MRNKRFSIFGTLIVVLVLLLIASFLPGRKGIFPILVPQANAQQIFKLKMTDMSPPTSIVAVGGQWWASEVEKRTGGQVKVECFWGSSLIGAYEQLNAVKAGIVHVAPYYSAYHPDLAPLPLIALLPLMNRGTLKEAMAAADEWQRIEPSVTAEFKKNNVKFMYPMNIGNQYLWSKVPIKSLGDLNGLRIRTFGPFLTLFKELGCGLVSVPLPEIYTALERGAVDCTTQYLSHAIGNRFYEVTKYLNITEFGHNCGAPIVMNLDTWNSLPPDIQTIINKINSEMTEKTAEIDNELYNAHMKLAKDSKMTIQQFTPKEVEKIVDLSRIKVWEPYVAKLDEKGIAATQALKHYIKLTEKYTKSSGR